MTDSKISKFWTGFGKLSAVLGALYLILTIYKILFPSSADLTITGEYNAFALPPDVDKNIKILTSMTSKYYLEDFISRPFKNEKYELISRIEEVAAEFADTLEKSVGEDFLYGVTSYKSFGYFLIENKRDKTASDIVFDLPISGIALITGQNEDQQMVEFKKNIKLNNLRPKNDIHLAMWSKESMSSYYEDDFKITHKGGVESISFGSTAFGFRKFVANNLYFLITISFLILLLVFGITMAVISEARK